MQQRRVVTSGNAIVCTDHFMRSISIKLLFPCAAQDAMPHKLHSSSRTLNNQESSIASSSIHYPDRCSVLAGQHWWAATNTCLCAASSGGAGDEREARSSASASLVWEKQRWRWFLGTFGSDLIGGDLPRMIVQSIFALYLGGVQGGQGYRGRAVGAALLSMMEEQGLLTGTITKVLQASLGLCIKRSRN
eukprot:1665479-Amphidinium_carterae.2